MSTYREDLGVGAAIVVASRFILLFLCMYCKLGSDQEGDAECASESRCIVIKLGSDQVGDADARRTPQHNKTW